MRSNEVTDEWATRQERRLEQIDHMLDEISAYAMYFADGAELTRDERPFRTEISIEFTYRRKTKVWMDIAVAFMPLRGNFEVSVTSELNFVVVPVELPWTLGDVFDAMLAIVERSAEA